MLVVTAFKCGERERALVLVQVVACDCRNLSYSNCFTPGLSMAMG
ncbi:hypothetical protein SLEP1_g2264 [Rubroshorea leprosula]|uniref:Uncharacterized protein n=1 Tax=Rubroshorea leprosula TaxID=152421 RepID=A0AAV5HGK8_9ROSI|nr:hypothetical protein SLEP1_g2264 [Rubroshorea leprosula]